MADRLTVLQDAINLQAEHLCNAVGVVQQEAQPSFFTDFNWNARSVKPEYQAILQDQNQQADISRNFASDITKIARQIEILINSLPVEEVPAEVQDEALSKLVQDYRLESSRLVNLITHYFEKRLTAVRRLLSRIAQVQLTSRSLESEAYRDFYGS